MSYLSRYQTKSMTALVKPLAEMGDCEFLKAVLLDHQWHTLNEILRKSFDVRGCGMTVHSRVSDLRVNEGLDIQWEAVKGANRGDRSRYRWVP